MVVLLLMVLHQKKIDMIKQNFLLNYKKWLEISMKLITKNWLNSAAASF